MSIEFDTYKKQIVTRANAVGEFLTGDVETVLNIVRINELVFGVWTDKAERDGVGMLIVKGAHLMRTIAAGGATLDVKWSAVPCTCFEQAEALRRVAGEPDMRN